MADEDGLITAVNAQFEQAFGWTAAEIVGRSLATIIPARLHDAHNLGFARFALTGMPRILNRPVVLPVTTKDGRELRAEHCIVAERIAGRWHFGATIRPETSSPREGKAHA